VGATAADHLEQLKQIEPMIGADAWVEMADCALATGDLDRAAELYERGVTVPTTYWLLLRPRLLAGAARVAIARRDFETAAERLQTARTYAEERAMKNTYPLLALAEGQLAVARGESAAALAAFERAEQLAAEMG